MRPSQAFQVLETLRNSSLVPLYRKGVDLSDDDNQTVLDVYQQWLLLCIDLGYLHPESLARDARRLWIDMIHADVYDLNSAFAECLQLIRLQTIRGFKGLCKRISTHLYSLIKDDLALIPQGNVFAAKRLIQLFSYTSRLSLNDIDLTQQLLEEYLENESGIRDSFPVELTRSLNRIIKRWVGIFRPYDIIPNHGPGGVAGHGRTSLENKYKDLSSDKMLEYAFGEPEWVCGSIRSSMDRISQTIFVPKSYKTFRTISMEPSTLQYFQQGIWKVIDHMVSKHGYLRNHIDFHDQLRNRSLAREGSISRLFATIDLSAASDSVSYVLVKKLFKGTWLLRYLVATRSTRTILPDGRIIALKKFAPMGSSLCFPIETIIFAAICEHVTRGLRISQRYSVFGDDIIVPTQCVDTTMRVLENLGFRINRDKSFYQSTCWFRESCGGEYCDGYDVTPMRISRKYASRERLLRLAKLIELANNAYRRGFRNLRYFFLKKLQDSGHKVLFAPTEVLADNYSNYHTRLRWNKALQRIDVKCSTAFAKYSLKDLSHQDEAIRLRHWFESTRGRISIGDGFESVICRPTELIKESWRMKPFELSDQEFIDHSLGGRESLRP